MIFDQSCDIRRGVQPLLQFSENKIFVSAFFMPVSSFLWHFFCVLRPFGAVSGKTFAEKVTFEKKLQLFMGWGQINSKVGLFAGGAPPPLCQLTYFSNENYKSLRNNE